jgi:hypothetical protein
LNYDTERKVLSVDTGAAWTQAAPPVLHVAQHKTGGADALALADIGAASATDVSTLTTNYNAHAASNQKHVPSATYVAKTSRTDQAVAWDDVVGKPTTFTPAEHTHDTIDAASVNGFTISADTSSHVATSYGDTYGVSGTLYSISGDVTTTVVGDTLTVTAGEDQTGEYTITFINITKV